MAKMGRIGEVRGRSQAYDPQNKRWTKRSHADGRFMDQRAKSETPFKGVRKEKRRRKKK